MVAPLCLRSPLLLVALVCSCSGKQTGDEGQNHQAFPGAIVERDVPETPEDTPLVVPRPLSTGQVPTEIPDTSGASDVGPAGTHVDSGLIDCDGGRGAEPEGASSSFDGGCEQ